MQAARSRSFHRVRSTARLRAPTPRRAVPARWIRRPTRSSRTSLGLPNDRETLRYRARWRLPSSYSSTESFRSAPLVRRCLAPPRAARRLGTRRHSNRGFSADSQQSTARVSPCPNRAPARRPRARRVEDQRSSTAACLVGKAAALRTASVVAPARDSARIAASARRCRGPRSGSPTPPRSRSLDQGCCETAPAGLRGLRRAPHRPRRNAATRRRPIAPPSNFREPRRTQGRGRQGPIEIPWARSVPNEAARLEGSSSTRSLDPPIPIACSSSRPSSPAWARSSPPS